MKASRGPWYNHFTRGLPDSLCRVENPHFPLHVWDPADFPACCWEYCGRLWWCASRTTNSVCWFPNADVGCKYTSSERSPTLPIQPRKSRLGRQSSTAGSIKKWVQWAEVGPWEEKVNWQSWIFSISGSWSNISIVLMLPLPSWASVPIPWAHVGVLAAPTHNTDVGFFFCLEDYSMTAAFIPISTSSSLATLLKYSEVKIYIHLRKYSRGRELHFYQGKPFQLLILGHLDPYCVSKSLRKSKKTADAQAPPLETGVYSSYV